MLKDKVVIVTGGSGLIGREIVKDIVRKGGIAVNADIHVSTDLNKREIYVDISDEQSVREVIRTVCQKFGRIDGLVNCAYPRTKDWGTFFEEIPLDSWRKNVDLQLNSCFLFCQQVLEIMAEQGSGLL